MYPAAVQLGTRHSFAKEPSFEGPFIEFLAHFAGGMRKSGRITNGREQSNTRLAKPNRNWVSVTIGDPTMAIVLYINIVIQTAPTGYPQKSTRTQICIISSRRPERAMDCNTKPSQTYRVTEEVRKYYGSYPSPPTKKQTKTRSTHIIIRVIVIIIIMIIMSIFIIIIIRIITTNKQQKHSNNRSKPHHDG